MAKKKKKTKKNDFVRPALKIGFWVMIASWVLSTIFYDYFIFEATGLGDLIFSLITISVIWTFVLSIIHLNKHKEKGFAVTALVISSIAILTMFAFYDSGEAEYGANNELYDNACKGFCYEHENENIEYFLVYTDEYSNIMCDCLDKDQNPLETKVLY